MSAHKSSEAWCHVDFCHAFAWVYEEGDKLLVRWGERSDENLYLHGKRDCERCAELRRPNLARHGEFRMDKPAVEFSTTETFFTVLAELAKWVPGLDDEAKSATA